MPGHENLWNRNNYIFFVILFPSCEEVRRYAEGLEDWKSLILQGGLFVLFAMAQG